MTTKIYKLRGDWLHYGYIDNLAMPTRMTIAIVDGRAYATDMDGRPDTRDPPLEINEDGALRHRGASVAIFQADDSEIDRIGRDAFRAA